MRCRIVLAIALAATPFAAKADLISPTFRTTWTDGTTVLFQKFDPALGVLTGVQVSESAVVGPIITYSADLPQGSDLTVGYGGIARLRGTGPAGLLIYGDRPFSGVTRAPSVADGSVTISANTKWTSALDSFVGMGNWGLAFSGDFGFLFEDHPSGVRVDVTELQTDLRASVTYEYTPISAVVPEPTSYTALLGASLGVMWWIKTRAQVRS